MATIPNTPDEFFVQVFIGALGLIKYFIKILPENPILLFIILTPIIFRILLLFSLSKKDNNNNNNNNQKTAIPKKSTIENKLHFDEAKSILHFQGQKIRIKMQNLETNAHKILKYIFITKKHNLYDLYSYAEIAEDEFGELEYSKKWQKYYTACKDIQEKIRKGTSNKIEDFLIITSGFKGQVKINPKYLPKQAEKPQEFLGKS